MHHTYSYSYSGTAIQGAICGGRIRIQSGPYAVRDALTPSLPLQYCFLYASTSSVVRDKHGVVYMRVVSTIIFKGHNSIILICSKMKELTFPRLISELRGRKLAFHRENGPFDEELVFFFKDGRRS